MSKGLKIAGTLIGVLLLSYGVSYLTPDKQVFGAGQPIFNSQGTQVYEVCNINAPVRTSVTNDLKNLKVRNPDQSLRELNQKERQEFKGCEIAKIKTVPKTRSGDYDIEIVDMNAVDIGVIVFARVWTGDNPKDVKKLVQGKTLRTIPANTQIGFGDGTVDVEQFIINNPPITIEDPTGSIITNHIDQDGNPYEIRHREDLEAATLKVIHRVLAYRGDLYDDSNIIAGKQGNTTSVFVPAEGTATPVDGFINKDNSTSWASTMNADDATGVSDSSTSQGLIQVRNNGAGGWVNKFAFLGFDVSTSTGADNLDSATMIIRITGTVKNNANDAYDYIGIATSTQADTNTIAVGDYDEVGTTSMAHSLDPTEDMTSGSDSTWTFKQAGLDELAVIIAGSGIAQFALIEGHATEIVDPGGGNENEISMFYSDQGSTQPLLSIIHTAVPVTDLRKLLQGMTF